MSRIRLILEGEFAVTEGLCEQVAMHLEPLGDVRVVKMVDVLAGCGVCRYYRIVFIKIFFMFFVIS